MTIKDYENRFPKINDNFFQALSEQEKELYVKRVQTYYEVLLDVLISMLGLHEVEDDFSKSKNEFKPIADDKKDMYQSLAIGKLKYLYLRNNVYIERLSEDQLKLLDAKSSDMVQMVRDTFKMVIDDYPLEKTLTNYGPDTKEFFTKSSNLVLGVRIDEDYFPDGVDKAKLLLDRDFELNFLKAFLENAIDKKMGMDGTVIIYTNDSVIVNDNKSDLFIQDIPRL